MLASYFRHSINSAMITVYLTLIFLYGISSNAIDDSKNAKILVYENKRENPNNYFFKYETSNGIRHEEEGKIVRSKTGEDILVVRGFYSFLSPDNVLYLRRYLADDKGYREEPFTDEAMVLISLKDRIGSAAISSLQGGGIGQSIHLTENRHRKSGDDHLTSKPTLCTKSSDNSLNCHNDQINEITQVHKNNKESEADGNEPQVNVTIENNNDTDLSKKSGELEFPDRIGTPAIISLQGPPGK